MTYPDQTTRSHWLPLPDMACLPGQGADCRSGRIPASPSVLMRRARNALPTERKLALVLTLTVWTLLASIAEIIRLAAPLTLNV